MIEFINKPDESGLGRIIVDGVYCYQVPIAALELFSKQTDEIAELKAGLRQSLLNERNNCDRAGAAELAVAELVVAMKDSMAWQVKNVQVWDNPPYDRAAHLVAKYDNTDRVPA